MLIEVKTSLTAVSVIDLSTCNIDLLMWVAGKGKVGGGARSSS